MADTGKAKTYSRSKLIGIALTIGLHLVILLVFMSSSLKSNPHRTPPLIVQVTDKVPPVQKKPEPIQEFARKEPKSETPDPKKEIKLVQRAESPLKGKKANKGKEATMGDKGDVARKEPERKKVIDNRALFPSDANDEEEDSQAASDPSDKMNAGHSKGNTAKGPLTGEPSARLAGRSVMGSLPAPEYNVNQAGTVVVRIKVDQYGSVISATPGAAGTTVQNRTLWEAAKRAALKAKFNANSSAAAVQEGVIIYIFRLK